MRLALVLPGVAIGFAGAIILGPGNPRTTAGARVYAAPAVEARVPSARIIAVRRLDGAEEAAAGERIVVSFAGGEVTATTGDDGVAEVVLDPPAPAGTRILIRAGDRTLADAALEIPLGEAATLRAPDASGHHEGALHVHVVPERGQMSPPFPERVIVSLSLQADAARQPIDGKVELSLSGGAPAAATVLPQGRATAFEVRPEALRVDVEARATAATGGAGSFVGSFVTVAGAIWIDPVATGELRVASPAPRPAAYLSLHTAEGRVRGFVVPLADDGHGFHRGAVPLPEVPPGGVVVASGDAEESGPATVSWPAPPGRGAASAPRLARIIDGVAPAEAAERARAMRARRLAVLVAALCGAASIASLLLEGRRAQRALEAHLRRAGEGATEETREGIAAMGRGAARAGSGTATLLAALVALAFGVVGALVLAR